VDTKRLYGVVAACAVVVYLGSLWNRFAMDDLYIIAFNPLVHRAAGIWQAFALPYWPADFGGKMYRPLVVASFAVDRLLAGPAWFHAVNLVWHAGASVAVTALARRWIGDRAALFAGVLFAVHPVHVEAVANVIGRAELMAALFACLAVYAALVWDSVGWCAAALAAGLLSKENAAVAPGLIVWAWLLGMVRPSRRRMTTFIASWVLVALAYGVLRWVILHPYTRTQVAAPIFIGASPLDIRLTAIAALVDIARLLIFPLTLRADYSPNERTLVTSIVDWRFVLGLLVLVTWASLLVRAWRRRRVVEAFGLGWIAIAFLPVANLLFPTGILIAERTLYLPSAGLALAAGAWLRDLPARKLWMVTGAVLALGGLRTALRVPVWKDDTAVTSSILDDSPESYRGPARTAGLVQGSGNAKRALEYYRTAVEIYDRDPRLFVGAADAAFTLGQSGLADTLLTRTDRLCFHCVGYLRLQAAAAYSRGDHATSDSLLTWAARWARERP